MNPSKDGLICAYSTWLCTSQKQLSDIVTATQEKSPCGHCRLEDDVFDRCEAVCLERAEEGSPCVLTLMCTADAASLITSVEVVSEGRTIEVYSVSGEYCGTCRGKQLHTSSTNGPEERRPLYNNFLMLDSPASSCEVKLLSFGGRSSVAIAHVGVRLEILEDKQGGLTVDQSIDLQRVQAMMEEMGTTLSPGAQNLLELVQSQQKNKSNMLSGFIPFLVGGGALSCLSRRGGASSAAEEGQHPLTGAEQPLSFSSQNQISSAMSTLLNTETGTISPELLPMLQSVCGQVTQIRLEEATSPERKRNQERESLLCCGGFEKVLEKVVEKRMEEMEKRLKEHLDLRLDALQQRLEMTLQEALSHMPTPPTSNA